MAKKKENKIVKDLRPALSMAGVSIGSSILGGSLQPKLPAGVTNPVTQVGTTTSKFVAPVATLGTFSIVDRELSKVSRKMKGGKK